MNTDITIYVIEDNFFYREKISSYLISNFNSDNVSLAVHAVEDFNIFFKKLSNTSFSSKSIFIIDIDLAANITGIDIAKRVTQISQATPLIFLTGQKEKARDVINSGCRPTAYIVKELNEEEQFEDLKKTIESIIGDFMRNTQSPDGIMVNYKRKDIIIRYEDICYITTIKGERGKVLIQLVDRQIICSEKFNKLKKEITAPYFLTDLKFLIMNLANIKEIDRNNLQLKFVNNIILNVGTKIISKVSQNLKL